MSRVRRIKKKKGSKKTLKVPRQQYVPPQRHQQDETEAEPNLEDEPTVEETQAVLLKGEYDPKELSERQPVHVEPRSTMMKFCYCAIYHFYDNWKCLSCLMVL
ncbi:hypothetical protein AVEN_119965-2 [Araneus ventricosus]|uniref:Uncharacterized protein n=1 Tax=Araneus ventricosus TaxID=182803 RepID=A0A4Y2TYD6_ARAVE|nr:hypothetical protein AVEN_119965-2 [Araneus ventricosus]